MKQLLSLFIILCLAGTLQASIVRDLDGLFSEEELQQLEDRCSELQTAHNLNLYIYFLSNPNDKPKLAQNIRGSTKYVRVFINRADTTVTVNTVNADHRRSTFLKQAFFQFVGVPMKEGTEIIPAIYNTLNVIEEEFERLELEDAQRMEAERTKDDLDPRAVRLIKISIFIFIGFIILFIVKGAKAGNRYEAVEFYGLSRLPLWGTITLGILAFLGGSLLIIEFVGNGAWMVVMCYLFTFYPVMVFLGGVIKGLEDSIELSRHASEKPHLTFGQQLWLIRPAIATEHLMEVNFYELVIKKVIHLEIETSEIQRRNVTNYYVSVGAAFDPQTTFPAELAVFLKELKEKPERLEPFLHRVYKSFGRFKAYRKDYLLKGLYRSGLLMKLGWPFNYFSLSPEGRKVQNRIKEISQKQANLIREGIANPSRIKNLFPALGPEVLLIEEFEQVLTHLYNEVVELNLLQEAMALPFGFIFHPEFSLRAFNLKLIDAYKYKIAWEDFPDTGNYVYDW